MEKVFNKWILYRQGENHVHVTKEVRGRVYAVTYAINNLPTTLDGFRTIPRRSYRPFNTATFTYVY